MTVLVDSLAEITDRFEAFVIDQWGVLHNGHEPYQTAQVALSSLQRQAKPVLILSNSGRRSQFNAIRLAKLGFAPSSYSFLLSSGEAVWADLQAGVLPNTRRSGPLRKCLAIARAPAEVEAWFEGLTEVSPEAEAGEADIALLLSLRNGAEPEDYDALIAELNKHRLVLLCANPDLVAPSAKGLLWSPGSVAERYAKIGGEVVYYGKPHAPIFRHSMRLLGQPAVARTLMIGDTLGTDILGGHNAGLKTMLVRGGALAVEFDGCASNADLQARIAQLADREAVPRPDYSLETLRF